MISPSDLGLPQGEWRKFQLDTVMRAVEAKTPYVGIEAPPGSGKSVTALAVARMLDSQRTYILTGTKQLQRQYLGTAPGIVQVKGRQNFDCLIAPVKADDAPCTYGAPCTYAGANGQEGCAYYDQKRIAWRAKEVVFNYPYFLAEMNYVKSFGQPDVLICDEAHTIDEQLMGFASIRLSQRQCELLGVYFPRELVEWGVGEWSEWAQEKLTEGDFNIEEYDSRTVVKAKRAVSTALHSLVDAQGQWVVNKERWGYLFRPVWVDHLAKQYLLKFADKIIFLSATLGPRTQFCNLLGIEPDDLTYVSVGSTFDPARRPIYYMPVGKVSAKSDESVQSVVRRVDEILDAHPGERGLVHTVSYKLAQAILAQCRNKGRLYTHEAGDREEAIEYLGQRPDGVLVSPSVGVGVDLPHDLCRFQVLCKLPFPDLGDRQVAARMEGPRGKSWYPWATKNNLVQQYGRIMRAPDDYGVTYLIDGNWQWFKSANSHMIPPWVSEAVHKKEGIDEAALVKIVRQFKAA